MNPYLKRMLIVPAAIAALTVHILASSAAAAGPSLGFSKGKPYYGASNQRASQSRMRSQSMYRSTAPVIVRSESAPSAVAQAPTEERRFSYEPSQRVQAGRPCPEVVVTEPAPATAERPTQTYRRFSYEPGIERSAEPSVRTYSRPMRRSSPTPAYLLPKTDPRKYRTH